MTNGRLNNWLSYALLMGSLAAGGVMTQLMPAYHGPEHAVTYPTKSSITKASNNTPSGMSGIDVDKRRLTAARSKS
jgi:hypothetical protein